MAIVLGVLPHHIVVPFQNNNICPDKGAVSDYRQGPFHALRLGGGAAQRDVRRAARRGRRTAGAERRRQVDDHENPHHLPLSHVGQRRGGGEGRAHLPLEVRQLIGYLPETLPLYPNADVHTYLQFVGKARGLQGAVLRERTDWVVQRCGLAPMYRKLIRELSKGYRQRVGLAQALIHDPQVIMLDEPTSGLDPHQILEIRHLIRRLARDKTVLLSTHILQEVEAVADRIVIINNGLIVGDGTPQELNQRAQQRQRLHLAVSGGARKWKRR